MILNQPGASPQAIICGPFRAYNPIILLIRQINTRPIFGRVLIYRILKYTNN